MYLERLDRKQELLPKNLITGTQGIVWVRLLSSAVKKYGGNVLAFDHAPIGDLAKESVRMFDEIDFADVFYTFNSKHVKYWSYLINKFKSKDFNLVIKKVKKEKRKIILKNTNYNLFKKKILLVAQPFMIHDFQMCCFPQPIQFNWHLKLIYNLKKFGYEVTYKPHPFSDKNIVKKLCKISAIKSKNKLLEEIYHQYDYLLFDCRSTSAWGFALSTNIPIIFIDFMKFNFFHEDNLKLKKRVSVIKGKIDKYNNPIINFNKLKYVIHYSEKLKTDKTFFNSFIN